MPITINGAGSIVGISAGGLPDASVITVDIADANVTAAKLSGAQTGTAPIYGCRAWVNFDGTRNEADTGASTNGANVKIRASGTVSSVLKNANGNYTITFTTALPDANYSFPTSISYFDGSTPPNNPAFAQGGARAAGSLQLYVGTLNSNLTQWAAFDTPVVNVAIFR
jgi:hypothetical protein